MELSIFSSNSERKNLRYSVLYKENDDKYEFLRNLIQTKHCPTIVYVSRTKLCNELAERLSNDGLYALPFNGKMDSAEKIQNQNAFMIGEANGGTDIIVATSAFGMGVDKANVGLIVHYEISSSLENYVQESGRAAREQSLTADCYILFNDSDLDKHFSLLTQTKLSISEINQIWKAVKKLSGKRGRFTRTALEIARAAGWNDAASSNTEIRVKSAVSALENAGYLQRGRNAPRIYATGILAKNAAEANSLIEKSKLMAEDEKMHAIRATDIRQSAQTFAISYIGGQKTSLK